MPASYARRYRSRLRRADGPCERTLAAMKLPTELYETQLNRWPPAGRHILAHFDDSSIIVYQAYRPSIGRFAVENGRLGGPDFSFSRMSWIKLNFLWVMYRSGWGTKEGQEVTLALRIRRAFFDSLLAQAVPSTCPADYPGGHGAWRAAVAESEVRLQWDPDHSPTGAKQERRAIQLGVRGRALEGLAGPELMEVVDVSDFVCSQRSIVQQSKLAALHTPIERTYPLDGALSSHLGASAG
jgi:hypothetical protein